jgi:ribonuclease VapC
MFIDASALVAIIAREPDAPSLEARMRRAAKRFTSALAMYEAVLGLARLGNTSPAVSQELLQRLVHDAAVQVIPVTAEIGRGAVEAFIRFGRGNHPARLNMGDCFAYACARSLGVPLLFKGNDFTQTDIAIT